MKTSELTGAALDWAVALSLGWKWKAEGKKILLARPDPRSAKLQVNATSMKVIRLNYFKPTASWSIAGPIIEREKIGFWFTDEVVDYGGNVMRDPGWYAESLYGYSEVGPTPLVAAMRCYVASKLGDEVDIPEELE